MNAGDIIYATDIKAGTLSTTASSAGVTNTTVELSFSATYNANIGTNVTAKTVVGPAITGLATAMTGAATGLLKKTAADTYSLDTNTYLTAEADTLSSVAGRGASTATQCTFSGGVITTDLSAGASSTAGTITGNWSLSSGSKLQSTYADLAEYYSSDVDYEPGTVLIFGGEQEVTVSNKFEDKKLAGVVTTNPAYVLNNSLTTTRVCIALQGRVPVKVVGKIEKGDMITTSNTEGYATKSEDHIVGTIIGKALQNKDTLEPGVIEVAVGRV